MTVHSGVEDGVRIFVHGESDVAWARRVVRGMGELQGLSQVRTGALATAVTEIARNIVVHAGRGELWCRPVSDGRKHGVVVIARDEGPGIADIARAMEDGYSTGDGLGMGLSGARNLVDAFEIESAPGAGVTVKLTQWCDSDKPLWSS